MNAPRVKLADAQQSITTYASGSTPKMEYVVTEVTTFAQADVNRAFQQWEADEAKRMRARKAYDDAVIAGLEIAYSSQVIFNATQAAATKSRTDYYALVSAYKKQLRDRAKA